MKENHEDVRIDMVVAIIRVVSIIQRPIFNGVEDSTITSDIDIIIIGRMFESIL